MALQHDVVRDTIPGHAVKHVVVCGVTSDPIVVCGVAQEDVCEVGYKHDITCGAAHISLFVALALLPNMSSVIDHFVGRGTLFVLSRSKSFYS